MIDEDLTVGSQGYRARRPVEQLDAKIGFERLDPLRSICR